MSKKDRQGVRNPTDLERKYDLGAIEIVKKAVKNNTEGINKTNTILEQFVNATVGTLENLQSQIDGNITTHFYSGAPLLENTPASEWLTDEEKTNHLGDLYYDKDTGYAYRFTFDEGEYQWIKLNDSDITEALAIANAAKDTADNKRRTFVDTPTPPYDVGDLWLDEQELYVCQFYKVAGETFEVGDFVLATKYTDDTVATRVGEDLEEFMKSVEANYSTTVEMESAIVKSEEKITASVNKKITENVDILQQQIDGAIETFTGSEEPTLLNIPANEWTTDEDKNKHIGDLYIVNSDGGDLSGFYYRFEKKETTNDSGETTVIYHWVLLKDSEITKALQDAKEANERAEEIAKNIEENYSTTVEMEAKIEETAEEINIEVSKKVGTDELIAQINLASGVIRLVGNRIVIESDNFTLSENGNVYMNGEFSQTTEDGIKSVEIKNNQIKLYDWQDTGKHVGSVGATKNSTTGKIGIDMWCEEGDYLSIGCRDNSQPEGASIMPVIRVNSDTYDEETPWVRNTVNGTLFPNNPEGGVVIEHGFIKDFGMSGKNVTLFDENPSGGIVVKDGLIVTAGLTTISGTITLISGLSWNSSGITSVTSKKLTFADGLLIDVATSTTTY